jgi:cytochrome c oxidase subunit II
MKLVLALLAFFTPALALAALDPTPEGGNGWGFPRDVSLHGWRIDQLIEVTMVFVVILFVIMVVWMLIAMLKHGENHTAEYDHGDAQKQVIKGLALSSIIFFVVDGNLFVNSVIDTTVGFWNFDHAESQENTVRLEINARQWAWDTRYAGPDGQFNTGDDIITVNEIRIPEKAPVIVQLASSDVLHSFYLPHLRVKTDAVPGMVNRFWFQAQETGVFEIGCAQHCGMAHYKMKGLLTVMPQAEFAAWASLASQNAQRAFDANDTTAHWGWNWTAREF